MDLKKLGKIKLGFIIAYIIFCFNFDSTFASNHSDDQQKWGLLPVLAMNSETSLQLGGLGLYFFPSEPGQFRPSTISLALIASLNKQYTIDISPKISFPKYDLFWESKIAGKIWPANYYLKGNQGGESLGSYSARNFETRSTLEKRLGDFFVGGKYRLRYEDVFKSDNDVVLYSGEYGVGKYLLSGVGFLISYDTRNSSNSPSKGVYIKHETTTYQNFLGSSYDYTEFNFSAAYYQKIYGNIVGAFGATFESSIGEVPFREMKSPDGVELLRGAENGHFRDKNLYGLQAEVRFPIFWRFGGVAFADWAQVTKEINDFDWPEFHGAYGLGLRYALNPEQKLNVRGDLSYVEGGIKMSIDIREAF